LRFSGVRTEVVAGEPDGPALPASAEQPLKRKGTGAAPRRRRRLAPPGLPWIVPALVIVFGVIYYGIGYTAYISTLNWDGTSPNPAHVGARNYVQALHDPVFWAAIRHTVVFFAVTFTVQTVLGLVLAVLLHSRMRFKPLYRIMIFIPVVLAPALMAPVFRQIFGAAGQFNWLLQHVGLGAVAQPWLAQPSTAIFVIMAATIWEWTGLNFILYHAAISQIDREVIEAARLDGVGNVRLLTRVIWPLVRGTTISLLVLSIIGALRTFDLPWLISQGGPDYATEFLGTRIYRETIPLANVGYGAALSILLLFLAVTTSIGITVHAARRGRKGNA
jgi:raffinose/stachyose/melibiose transport system permease protein